MTTSFELPPLNEFRVEVRLGFDLHLRLLRGTAEIFGYDLPPSHWLKFPPGHKFAVFTWFGATIEIYGVTDVAYVTPETPMASYRTVHSMLEKRRAEGVKAPRVLIVGPSDSGKSTMSKILLGWATRQNWQPLFVDLDVGQGSLTIPGAIAATSVDKPVDPISGIPLTAPFVYFYGHTSPSNDPGLYRFLVGNLSAAVAKNTKVQASGMVINTMGWVEDLGYQLILHAIDAFKADMILVMGEEKLHNCLRIKFETKSDINVLYLERSKGVAKRSPNFRRLARNIKIQEYFYGSFSELSPHSDSVSFNEVKIYKLKCSNNKPQVHPVNICKGFIQTVLGVFRVKRPEQLIHSTVAGFIYVTDIDLERKRLSYVAPCPEPLSSVFLVIGSLVWKT